MPRFRHVIAPVAIAAATGLLLTACSGGPGATEKLTYDDSPLQKYMSAVYGDYGSDESKREQKEIEEHVATCMSDEGFEYIPVDQTQYMSFDDEDRNTIEWVTSYGYGANLSSEEQEEVYGSPQEYVDPNSDYVMSLSESEMTAYYEVLYGPPQVETPIVDGEEGVVYEYNWETAGCRGWAEHEVQGDSAYEQDQFKDLFEEINTIYEDVQKDPRMKELDAAWASCMADGGHGDFKQQWDAAQSIYDQQNEFWENNTTGEMPDDDLIKKWRDEEVEVAIVDFNCKEKTDYMNKSLAIQFEVEQEFIDTHKAELDELVAFAENAKK